MLREDWIPDVVDLYKHTDGALGLHVLRMPVWVREAFGALDEGKAERMSAEAKKK